MQSLERRDLLATFTVTGIANSGAGSLRQAIEDANDTVGADVIEFDIPGAGPHVIQPSSALPDIDQEVLIDGWSQPGFNGSPVIAIDGQFAGDEIGLDIRASDTVMRGLAVYGFNRDGIRIRGANDVVVQGNYVGLKTDGVTARPNADDGIQVDGGSQDTLIGSDGNGSNDAQERNIISGNGDDGIVISDASRTIIAGNIVGLTADGSAVRPNIDDGIQISGTTSTLNTIGGDSAAERNVISGNGNDGVTIDGSSNNTVRGNYIGTTIDGLSALPNADDGILISADSSGNPAEENTIGGNRAADRNVISGNSSDGVVIFGASNNTISANYIGVGADGTTPLGNRVGVLVRPDNNGVPSDNNIVGGTTDVNRNVISANREDGVDLNTDKASNNVIRGNYIGTTADGQSALPNADDGIELESAKNTSVIDNLVSGNTSDGIDLVGATGSVITGNLIGVNAAGSTGIPNESRGIQLREGSTNNRIGGTAPLERNVISGNTSHGISLRDPGTSSNRVIANYLGTDKFGMDPIPNRNGVVIQLGATNNEIGGVGTGEGNLLSGNIFDGIEVRDGDTVNNTIRQNFIGTNVSGTLAIPNGSDGVEFDGAGPNILGGRTASARNVISGNASDGVEVWRAAQGQFIEGNYIGTTADGLSPLGNARDGVTISGGALQGNPPTIVYVIDVSGSTVSETFAGTAVGDIDGDGTANTRLDAELDGFMKFTERLVAQGFGNAVSVGISIFGSDGAALDMSPTQAGTQLSTLIGTDTNNNNRPDVIDVLASISQGQSGTGNGTEFSDALNSAVTTFTSLGTRSGDGNIIFVSDGENNSGDNFGAELTSLESLGVKRIAVGIGSDARLNELERIDPDATLVTSTDEFTSTLFSVLGLSPAQSGSQTVVGTNVTVGGTAVGAGNLIAYNGRDGVDVQNFLALGNSILGNRIHSNERLGINLGHRGVDLNDIGDTDQGANGLTNFPVITSTQLTGNNTQINGTMNGRANHPYRLEFFGNSVADDSGHGEGEFYLGSANVTTNASGTANFSESYLLSNEALWISATATDNDNNTSEFSVAVEADNNLPKFTVEDVSANEDAGTLDFTVQLDKPINGPVAVRMNFENITALLNDDYLHSPIIHTFPANSTAPIVYSVPIIDDNLVEPTETFRATLSTPNSNVNADFTDTAIGSIIDNDVVFIGDFSVSSNGPLVVSEAGTTSSFNVVLLMQPTVNVVLDVVANDGGEAAVSTSTLTFTPDNWNTAQTVTVSGVDDNVHDDSQTSTITVSVDDANSDNSFDAAADEILNVTTTDDEQNQLDLDRSGTPDAATDGILVIRYLFGIRGERLTDGAIEIPVPPGEIETRIRNTGDMLDVDGNGTPDAATDGILFIRYLFGSRNFELVDRAIGPGATRTTAAEIVAFLDSFQPAVTAPSFGSQGMTSATNILTSSAIIDQKEPSLFAADDVDSQPQALASTNDDEFDALDTGFSEAVDWISIL